MRQTIIARTAAIAVTAAIAAACTPGGAAQTPAPPAQSRWQIPPGQADYDLIPPSTYTYTCGPGGVLVSVDPAGNPAIRRAAEFACEDHG
jgi:hypothetical protein